MATSTHTVLKLHNARTKDLLNATKDCHTISSILFPRPLPAFFKVAR